MRYFKSCFEYVMKNDAMMNDEKSSIYSALRAHSNLDQGHFKSSEVVMH